MQKKNWEIVGIRQEVIDGLPRIYLKSFSHDENDYLNEWMAYALRYAKENNDSGEIGILLDVQEWSNYDIVIGTRNKVSFNTQKMKMCLKTQKNRYILIHNHPNNKIFSDRDIFNFCKMEAVMGMIVVGNQGSIYAIIKKDNFDKFCLIEQYEKELTENRQVHDREFVLQKTLEKYQDVAGFEFAGGNENVKW
ncbi:MAG: hypothetical protein IJO65_08915 [Lachnospiraceae bacterium]|nr:hypothetical protein [Lachnospiraceae bacterium]